MRFAWVQRYALAHEDLVPRRNPREAGHVLLQRLHPAASEPAHVSVGGSCAAVLTADKLADDMVRGGGATLRECSAGRNMV